MKVAERVSENYADMTIGKIVARDFRKAMVFKAHGIDFCCGGAIALKSALEEKNIDLDSILMELKAIDRTQVLDVDYENWSSERLIDHILDKHHGYVRRIVEQLTPMLAKVEMVHGGWRPELVEINRLYTALSQELLQHMRKEEEILFPAIRTLGETKNAFGSIAQPISMMEHEHDSAGDFMKRIHELTDGYTLPKGACATYTVVYKTLNEFEEDLFTHIHLENNILFPRAMKLEEKLNSK